MTLPGKHPWMGKIFALANLEPGASGTNRSTDHRSAIGGGCEARACSRPMTSRARLPIGPRNFLPALDWTPQQPQSTSARAARIGRQSWLRTAVPVENVNTGRSENPASSRSISFASPGRFRCERPHRLPLKIGRKREFSTCGRKDRRLVFWFRNPLSATRSILAWYVHDAFKPGQDAGYRGVL